MHLWPFDFTLYHLIFDLSVVDPTVTRISKTWSIRVSFECVESPKRFQTLLFIYQCSVWIDPSQEIRHTIIVVASVEFGTHFDGDMWNLSFIWFCSFLHKKCFYFSQERVHLENFKSLQVVFTDNPNEKCQILLLSLSKLLITSIMNKYK